ncbi:MAG TPA: FAD-dependent oxidoreductase, partial [Dehalococcoidales bacterium]|nr:FAD-dependent oxidoreductase [Dehalococcoidales bacterium]
MANPRYQVSIVDADYYRRVISCQNACPVHTDAQGYVNAVSGADYRAGYVRARQPNPFASTCGRICAAHCEKACRRGRIDAPITIRALKRFLCETYGVEALKDLPAADGRKKAGAALLTGRATGNAFTLESFSQLSGGVGKAVNTVGMAGHRVAVVGAGPAGLAAAHDLALLGHGVTVFEAAPAAGGMAVLGIPEYRLPRDLLKREIAEVLDLGVELRLNTRLGKDFDLAGLKTQGFEAVFIAIGAHKDRGMDIEGVQLDGVLAAVDFLLNVNLGYRAELGDKVVVVGGGDVAVDAARVAARLGETVYEQLPSGELVTAAD